MVTNAPYCFLFVAPFQFSSGGREGRKGDVRLVSSTQDIYENAAFESEEVRVEL